MMKFIRNTAFFIGWLLSPLTFWNDAFVNIPLSYLLANLLVRFININFLWLVLASYWLTNVLGLWMMYAAGKGILAEGRGIFREALKLILTMAAYSAVLVFLHYIGLLRPIRLG